MSLYTSYNDIERLATIGEVALRDCREDLREKWYIKILDDFNDGDPRTCASVAGRVIAGDVRRITTNKILIRECFIFLPTTPHVLEKPRNTPSKLTHYLPGNQPDTPATMLERDGAPQVVSAPLPPKQRPRPAEFPAPPSPPTLTSRGGGSAVDEVASRSLKLVVLLHLLLP